MLEKQTWTWLLFIGLAAFGLMILTGNSLINWLKALPNMKWSAREDTPDTHLKKAGTPSMGGLGIIGAAICAVWGFGWIYTVMSLRGSANAIVPAAVRDTVIVEQIESTIFLAIIAGFMWLGFVDDKSKAQGRGGLRARDKFAWQLVLTTVFLVFWWLLEHKDIFNPGIRTVVLLQEILFYNWFSIAIVLFGLLILLVGTCNAVNLTDGIDGLAAGCMAISGVALALCNEGPLFDSAWLGIAITGACLGFLFFNKYPARVFMGDTGSLALGAALGMCAVLNRCVFLLPFIGFIFYIEMFSVMAQVAYFKITKKKLGEGKRLFRRAPIHHHYELAGWSETRVVATFWLIHLVMTSIGVLLWKMEVIPRWP